MCVLAFAWRHHPGFPMVIAGNRDEFHQRPSAPADWWEDHPDLLAGRDLQGGGTWMGMSRGGRFAVATNIREPRASVGPAGPSRGELVREFLSTGLEPAAWQATVDVEAYRGFNLIFGDLSEARYLSNRDEQPRRLSPGLYGLSNHLLDTPWPKLVRARDGMARCLRSDPPNVSGLFRMLEDRETADDDALPETGVPATWEKLLSPVFIVTPAYGTRASTVMMIGGDGEAYLEERGFDPSGTVTESRRFDFRASPGAPHGACGP